MSDDKKVGLNIWGNPSKTGKQWNEQKGRLKTLTPEERKEFASKGGKAKAKNEAARKQMKEMLANPDGFREEAIQAILAVAPDAMEKLAEKIYEKALEGDKFAMDMAIRMFALDAPRKTELKITEESSTSDILKELKTLGVDVNGVNTIDMNKKGE